ncbi:MAG TPA: hypothetical protein VNO22_00690 [Planctomycetota bacterium]|jgi:hypothetical protein|nr:hypothetical protein [Planctomycetota bacterium]
MNPEFWAFLCPGCKESLDPAQARAFEWSIAWLLTLVYGVGAFIVRAVLRAFREDRAAAPASRS